MADLSLGMFEIERFMGPFLRSQAYLDPGSGSFFLQLLIASLLGALFVLKTYWGRVKAFFARLFKRSSGESEEGHEI
jgi:hypothetical protein